MIMTDSNTEQVNTRESAWAKPVDQLAVEEVPEGAVNLNVELILKNIL